MRGIAASVAAVTWPPACAPTRSVESDRRVAATAAGASLEGAWANRAAHTAFALIEAPDAHTVDEIVGTAGLIGWPDSRVFAVATLEQVAESVRTSTS